MCEHLELVSSGDIKNLVICVPPGHMKTLSVTVNWPVWTWLKNPETRWIFSSYSLDLSILHSIKRRRLIRSSWFQERWNDRFALVEDQERKSMFENEQGGWLMATSTSGTTGGKHGDFLIADDPINTEMGYSRSERERGNDHVEFLFSTRKRDQKDSRTVLIMQRVHHDDAVARIEKIQNKLAKKGISVQDLEIISLPSIFTKKTNFSFPKTEKIIQKEPGDLLWEDKFGRMELNAIKEKFGQFKFEAQYQQNPTPEEGGLVHQSWWKYFTVRPRIFQKIGWYWDTASKIKTINDYSCGVLMGKADTGTYILNRIRKRLLYPDLKRELRNCLASTDATFIMVEEKSSGESLVPDLKKDGLPIIGQMPKGDKIHRLSIVSPIIESGCVYLPEDATWVHDFIEEFNQFPMGAFDDQVDATVIGLTDLHLKKKAGSFSDLTETKNTLPMAGSLRGGLNGSDE